uniref:dUTPase superfamily n=1 Tax=uncultured organism TaxID=155900 RepID=M1Q1H8_9ZZZZ|nr:dUTPase superfamily [uncultured organism]
MPEFSLNTQNGEIGDLRVKIGTSLFPEGRYDFSVSQEDGEEADIEFSDAEELFIFADKLRKRAVELMDPECEEGTGALPVLLKEQEDLDQLIRNERDVSWESKAAELNDLTTALGQEVEELRNTTDWKWWSENSGLKEEEAKEELIDVFFFALSAANLLGLSTGEILRLYKNKAVTNRERVQGDY